MDEFKLGCKPYHRGNVTYARMMRQRPTPAEDKMWQEILKHRP